MEQNWKRTQESWVQWHDLDDEEEEIIEYMEDNVVDTAKEGNIPIEVEEIIHTTIPENLRKIALNCNKIPNGSTVVTVENAMEVEQPITKTTIAYTNEIFPLPSHVQPQISNPRIMFFTGKKHISEDLTPSTSLLGGLVTRLWNFDPGIRTGYSSISRVHPLFHFVYNANTKAFVMNNRPMPCSKEMVDASIVEVVNDLKLFKMLKSHGDRAWSLAWDPAAGGLGTPLVFAPCNSNKESSPSATWTCKAILEDMHTRTVCSCAKSPLKKLLETASLPTKITPKEITLLCLDLVVPESERVEKTLEKQTLPKVRLTKIAIEWVLAISEARASPLKRFMRENEYLQNLHFTLGFETFALTDPKLISHLPSDFPLHVLSDVKFAEMEPSIGDGVRNQITKMNLINSEKVGSRLVWQPPWKFSMDSNDNFGDSFSRESGFAKEKLVAEESNGDKEGNSGRLSCIRKRSERFICEKRCSSGLIALQVESGKLEHRMVMGSNMYSNGERNGIATMGSGLGFISQLSHSLALFSYHNPSLKYKHGIKEVSQFDASVAVIFNSLSFSWLVGCDSGKALLAFRWIQWKNFGYRRVMGCLIDERESRLRKCLIDMWRMPSLLVGIKCLSGLLNQNFQKPFMHGSSIWTCYCLVVKADVEVVYERRF